jgi:hypothetical protein
MAVVGLVLLVALLLPAGYQIHRSGVPQDEGFLLVYPSLVLNGAIPNRDFESVYGLGSLLPIAAAFKIFGTTLTVERLVGLAYRALLVGSVATLMWRRSGPIAAALAGGASILLLFESGLASYAWIGAVGLGVLGIVLIDVWASGDGGDHLLVASGIAFGFAVSYRLDLALPVGLAVAIIAYLRPRARVRMLIGCVVGLLPFIVNVFIAGPITVIRGQLLDPVFVTGPGRRLPLSLLPWDQWVLLCACVLIPVALIAAGWLLIVRDRRDVGGLVLLAYGAFGVSLTTKPSSGPTSDICSSSPRRSSLGCWRCLDFHGR